MNRLVSDWYHQTGHMAGDIESAVGTEPMAINWRHWLSLPLWKKQQAVLLICGLEPNKFHQVESHKDYKNMCGPFIELFQRTLEESNTPIGWLDKFKTDSYLESSPRGVQDWLTQHIEQVQLKTQSEAPLVRQTDESKPWLVANPSDPEPEQPWYTPARYFARELVIADSTLLTKPEILPNKIVQSLTKVGIYKRGGKLPFSPVTIKKALSSVSLG